MPGEAATADAPPVPSLWRLVWLLFMQPIALHRMYRAWGLERDPSLFRLWRLGRARDPAVRALLARYAFLLLVVMPLTVVLVAGALTLSGVAVEWRLVTVGVAFGVAFGVAVGVTVGVVAGAAGGVTFGVVLGVALGVAPGAPGVFIVAVPVAIGVTVGVALGVTVGPAFSVTVAMAFCVVLALVLGLVFGLLWGLAIGALLGVMDDMRIARIARVLGPVGSMTLGSMLGMVSGMVFGLMVGLAGSVAVLRLPLWLAEVLLTQLLAWQMRRRPDAARQLASWLPFRHHDLICLPLPGLRACLIQVGEVDAALGNELIAQATATIGQRGIARRALIELQARDLERVARRRMFARAAGLDLPFLPTEADLVSEPANAPLLSFQAAARDLIAGSTSQRQRALALERARRALESFSITATGTSRPTPLAMRLWSTADLWRDVIRDESAKLAREVAAHPEVPSAFIAGPPLTPERAEERTLFKGRSDIVKLIEHDLAPARRGVLLVVGQRRMGKTSLCNYLPTYLGTGTAVIVSNFQTLSGDVHRETPHWRVLGDIAARLIGTPALPASDGWGEGLRWLQDLDGACADRKILVVIDEVERVEDGIRDGWCSTDFLDFLRAAGDALQHIRFLLLTAYPLHRLGPHWTDCLVSVTSRAISYLGEDDARELLTRPIPDFPDIYPEGGVDRIIVQVGRHPYLLQKAGDDLCRLLNSRGGLRTATPDELTEVFDGMIRDVHVFDEIWRSRTQDEQATLRRLAYSEGPGELDPAAIQLAREDYLVRRGDRVTIAVPLFREWIRMNVM